jgi:hypothetical protein
MSGARLLGLTESGWVPVPFKASTKRVTTGMLMSMLF